MSLQKLPNLARELFLLLCQVRLGNIDKVQAQQRVTVPKTRRLLGKCEERTVTSSQGWLMGGEESSPSKSIHPPSRTCSSEGGGRPREMRQYG